MNCAYCGAALIRNHNTGQATEPVVHGVRFRMYLCPDSQGTGMDAFRLLVPAGWQPQGGVVWQNSNPGSPASIYFRVFDPIGMQAFTIFPHLSLFWPNDPTMRMTFPIGSLYFGNEVRPPLGAQQALRNLVVPRFRHVPGLNIIRESHLPDLLAQMRTLTPYNPVGIPQADGAKITFSYQENGQPIDEELYGVTEYNQQNIPSMFGIATMIFWTVDYLVAFRALSGKLEASRNLFQAILRSFQFNPHWFIRVKQISQYMIQNQIQQINNIGLHSRYISQVNNQISNTITQGYYQRQQVLDRINQQFSESIWGVDSYHDPIKDYDVELPGGYRYAWANALGDYIVSDSASFNPNIGSNINWTEMGKAG